MAYHNRQVARVCRHTRRTLEVVATGLTPQTASNLAATLRQQDEANNDLVIYAVQAVPLHAQVTHATAAATMAALNAGPLTLAA